MHEAVGEDAASTDADLAELLARLQGRVRRLLVRRGRLPADRRGHRPVGGSRAPVRDHRGRFAPGPGRPRSAGRPGGPPAPLGSGRAGRAAPLRSAGGLQPARRRGRPRRPPGPPRTPLPLSPPAPAGARASDGDLRGAAPLPAAPAVGRWVSRAAAGAAGALYAPEGPLNVGHIGKSRSWFRSGWSLCSTSSAASRI